MPLPPTPRLMNQIFSFLPAFLGSFLLYRLYSRNYKRLPRLKIRRIEIFPSLKIYGSVKIIHFHHWLDFSILLLIIIVFGGGIFDSIFIKGLLSGPILEGILPSNNPRVIYKQDQSIP